MAEYRTHHGVTINREGDGFRCDRADHDCARGYLVAVADVLSLPKPTRSRVELDLPPCGREWRTDNPGVWHRCWTWRGWPHICRCLRCHTEAGGRRG